LTASEALEPAPTITVDGAQRADTTVITKHFGFDSAHFLPNVPDDHKCRRMHGHSYQVWLHVSGEVRGHEGWIVDFAEIKEAWTRLNGRLDHHLLNELPGLENPTAENLAAWIWRELESGYQAGTVGFQVAAVEVAETVDSKALFVAPGRSAWVPGNPAVVLEPWATLPSREDERVAHSRAPGPRAATTVTTIEDVQERPDTRGVPLDEVGVSRVRMPIEVLDRDRQRQHTVALVSMGVNLPARVKGTHLSRFMQAIRDHRDAFTLFSLSELTADLRDRLNAERVRVRAEFPYFVAKAAPVSGEVGELDVDCAFEIVDVDGQPEHWLQVTTPVTTVCPCSRDISDYGAHNQRGHVTIRIRCANDDADLPSLVWIEELIELAEAASSSPVYPIVKRPDERHITMAGYDRPQFVEDVARDVALGLRNDARVSAFEVNVVNDESIHAHNAFARVSG
jgi:GTP cyclohydrolase IB